MNYVPKSVAFAAAKLEGFSRNRFRLETSGATSATAGSVVTINLPENAIIADESTTSGGTAYHLTANAPQHDLIAVFVLSLV